MKIKLSATFEGTCSICKKNSLVFTAGDEDTKKAVTICKECADGLGEMKLDEAIEKFGKKDNESFKKGIRFEKT